jgi:hypothetical protein
VATIDSISFSPSLLSFFHAVDLIYLTVDFIVYTQSSWHGDEKLCPCNASEMS